MKSDLFNYYCIYLLCSNGGGAMKEIHICNDGIIIRYKYTGKSRYIVHSLNSKHNGKPVRFYHRDNSVVNVRFNLIQEDYKEREQP